VPAKIVIALVLKGILTIAAASRLRQWDGQVVVDGKSEADQTPGR
jgi:hypothetical protein